MYKSNDKVKLLKSVGGFSKGDFGYVKTVTDEGDVTTVWTEDKGDWWYVDNSNITSCVPKLQTGMVLVNRIGRKMVLYTNIESSKDTLIYEIDGWDTLVDVFDKDTLTYIGCAYRDKDSKDYDIVSIYSMHRETHTIGKGADDIIRNATTLLWEREEIVEKIDLTISEIEEKLGYSIKVVNPS